MAIIPEDQDYWYFYEHCMHIFSLRKAKGELRGAWDVVVALTDRWKRETVTRHKLMPVMRWGDMEEHIKSLKLERDLRYERQSIKTGESHRLRVERDGEVAYVYVSRSVVRRSKYRA